MIKKNALFVISVGFLASCEKQENSNPEFKSEQNSGTTRMELRSIDNTGTRGKMRIALDLAKAVEPAQEKEKAIAQVAWDALDSAPDIAVQAIVELPVGNPEKEQLIQFYAERLAKRDFDAALAWGRSLTDEHEFQLVRDQVALILQDSDPQGALELFPNSGFATEGMNSSAKQVFRNWMTQNPGNAMAWVVAINSDEVRRNGLDMALNQWIQADSDSALKWVSSQGNRQRHEEVVNAIVKSVSAQPDPLREIFLEHADPILRAEIDSKIAEVARETEFSELETTKSPDLSPP